LRRRITSAKRTTATPFLRTARALKATTPTICYLPPDSREADPSAQLDPRKFTRLPSLSTVLTTAVFCIYNILVAYIHFVWDEVKSKENVSKHHVSFEEARTVFFDENARLMHDPDHSKGEDRFVLLGMSRKPRLLLVCHCYREDDLLIRIISARKATRAEARQYGG
jgi:hypothetical protein